MTQRDRFDRALGALYGVAVGDALGMPTQDLDPGTIARDYGQITGFLPAGPNQIIAAGQSAGTITDDTEQMVLVANRLIEDPIFNAAKFADDLSDWERAMEARGSLDLLGPSTKAAIEAIRRGEPPEVSGKGGTTNGAAMRAAPIGIATPPHPQSRLVERVMEVCRITHNTAPAMAAAAAVAGAVSEGVGGASLTDALRYAREVAEMAEAASPAVVGPSFVARWDWAVDYLSGVRDLQSAAYNVVGTTVASTESVVTAMALCELIPDPWESLCVAAGIGGDTDTIATIVGAVRGSVEGTSMFPAGIVDQVRDVNGLDFTDLARKLLARRDA